MVKRDGCMYWDVLAMYRHFVVCLDELEAKGVRPDSIGIDTWGVDFGCVGADGTLLGLPRCYRDPYTLGRPGPSGKRYCYESYRENCTKIAAFEPFLSLQSLSSRFNDRAAVDMISTAE